MDRDDVLPAMRSLQDAGVISVLIGAMAMGLHGIVRATEDMDLLVRADPENTERLRSAIRAT